MSLALVNYYRPKIKTVGASASDGDALEAGEQISPVGNGVFKTLKVIPGESILFFEVTRQFVGPLKVPMLGEHIASLGALAIVVVMRCWLIPGVFRPQIAPLLISLVCATLWVLAEGGYFMMQAHEDWRPYAYPIIAFLVIIAPQVAPARIEILTPK